MQRALVRSAMGVQRRVFWAPSVPCTSRSQVKSLGSSAVRATIHQHEAIKATSKLNTARLVKVSHILVAEDDAGTMTAIREALGGLDDADKSVQLEAFGSLAMQYSTCPSSRSKGDLGWVQVGQMVADFEDACFRSAPGDIVECTTEYGKHFIYIESEQAQGEVRPMSVNDLQVLLTTGELDDLDVNKNVQLLDVREPSEVEMSKLPGPWKLYSLSAFGTWGPEVAYMLDPDVTTIVLCHAGVRSAQVCQFLLRNQFRDLRNVTGGIAAYSRIDPSVPEY